MSVLISFTSGNSDNTTEAVHGLDIFTKNWCMNCKEVERQEDLGRDEDAQRERQAEQKPQVGGFVGVGGVRHKGDGADGRGEHGQADQPPGVRPSADEIIFRALVPPREVGPHGCHGQEIHDQHHDVRSSHFRMHDFSLAVL